MHKALIALGSNLGDRARILDQALAALDATPGIRVTAHSSYHETEPVGGPAGQGLFLNAAATLETLLEPQELLAAMLRVEQQFGRTREVRWGQRSLDLDLLLYDDLVIDTLALTIPHPRMAERRFVLEPAAEIAGDWIHPTRDSTIATLLDQLAKHFRQGGP